MTHHSHLASLLVLASTLGLAACDLGPGSLGDQPDGETGGESESESDSDSDGGNLDAESDGGNPTDSDSDTEDEPGNPGACGEETLTIITDLSEVPAGFDRSVSNIIQDASGIYAGTFTWNDNDGPVTITHAGTSSPLSMDVDYVDGEVRLTEVEFAGEFPNGQEGGEPCSNHLEIDVKLEFATEDGLFAEALVAPLDAYSHSEDPGPKFYLDWGLLEGHMGSLSIDDFAFADATIEALILSASFADDQASGGLNMQVETMDWVGFGVVASFSAELVGEHPSP
ncbi:hypothetical protein ACNOYE_33300 [Nannocystaceae bacterium ST9]